MSVIRKKVETTKIVTLCETTERRPFSHKQLSHLKCFLANQLFRVRQWHRDDFTQNNSSLRVCCFNIWGEHATETPGTKPWSQTAIYFNHSSKFLFAKYLPSHSPFIACAMSGYTPCPGIPIYVGIFVPEIAQQRFKCFSRIIYLFISCFPLECSLLQQQLLLLLSAQNTHTHIR